MVPMIQVVQQTVVGHWMVIQRDLDLVHCKEGPCYLVGVENHFGFGVDRVQVLMNHWVQGMLCTGGLLSQVVVPDRVYHSLDSLLHQGMVKVLGSHQHYLADRQHCYKGPGPRNWA